MRRPATSGKTAGGVGRGRLSWWQFRLVAPKRVGLTPASNCGSVSAPFSHRVLAWTVTTPLASIVAQASPPRKWVAPAGEDQTARAEKITTEAEIRGRMPHPLAVGTLEGRGIKVKTP